LLAAISFLQRLSGNPQSPRKQNPRKLLVEQVFIRIAQNAWVEK
jgi:hypothetical protein